MNRDYRFSELEDWAEQHDIVERAEATRELPASAKALRMLSRQRDGLIPFRLVSAVFTQMRLNGTITQSELDALMVITEFGGDVVKRKFLADNIVHRREEVAAYRDNARRFGEIAKANEPKRALPDRLKPFRDVDRMTVYADESLGDADVAEITQRQLCTNAKKSVRAELGEMAIAEAALLQLEAELAELAGAAAEADIEAAMIRRENSRAVPG